MNTKQTKYKQNEPKQDVIYRFLLKKEDLPPVIYEYEFIEKCVGGYTFLVNGCKAETITKARFDFLYRNNRVKACDETPDTAERDESYERLKRQIEEERCIEILNGSAEYQHLEQMVRFTAFEYSKAKFQNDNVTASKLKTELDSFNYRLKALEVALLK